MSTVTVAAIGRRWRGLAFLLIVAFMVIGPFYRQVLGHRNPIFRPWTMFSAVGLDLADVRFSQHLPDGRIVQLDHYRLLGHEDWRKAPARLRSIRGADGVRAIAQELCTALGPGADLRVTARIATKAGWSTEIMEIDGNHCVWPPDRSGHR